MTSRSMIACGCLLLAVSTLHASPGFTGDFPTLTGLHDTSNVLPFNNSPYFGGSMFGAKLTTDVGDADLYINGVNFVAGANWNPAIGLGATNIGTLNYDADLTYNLGTPIAGGKTMDFHNLSTKLYQVDSSVPTGFYNFSLQIVGGNSNSATDTLATLPFQVEVFDRLEGYATATASPNPISAGQQTAVTATMHNSMADRGFALTTVWVVLPGMTNGTDTLQWGGWGGPWRNQSMGPGGSYTAVHSYHSATASNPPGTYTLNLGAIGGLYYGDLFCFPIAPVSVEVVAAPEPACLAMVGLAGLVLIRKRR